MNLLCLINHYQKQSYFTNRLLKKAFFIFSLDEKTKQKNQGLQKH